MKLSAKQIAALRLAGSRTSGLVSAGHRFPTPASTLRSLARRGLVAHKGTAGTYYDRQIQYRITEAGRAALLEVGAWTTPAATAPCWTPAPRAICFANEWRRYEHHNVCRAR